MEMGNKRRLKNLKQLTKKLLEYREVLETDVLSTILFVTRKGKKEKLEKTVQSHLDTLTRKLTATATPTAFLTTMLICNL